LARAQRYDLFVLDVNMPGMTGFELCEKLRASSTYKETPVVFVTASDTFDSRLKFARSGGDDFIAKPFLRPELAAKALIHLLSRRLGLQKT
jgi:DNA-binding response OmpR family regulator